MGWPPRGMGFGGISAQAFMKLDTILSESFVDK
jgi:hypothetical protein